MSEAIQRAEALGLSKDLQLVYALSALEAKIDRVISHLGA